MKLLISDEWMMIAFFAYILFIHIYVFYFVSIHFGMGNGWTINIYNTRWISFEDGWSEEEQTYIWFIFVHRSMLHVLFTFPLKIMSCNIIYGALNNCKRARANGSKYLSCGCFLQPSKYITEFVAPRASRTLGFNHVKHMEHRFTRYFDHIILFLCVFSVQS